MGNISIKKNRYKPLKKDIFLKYDTIKHNTENFNNNNNDNNLIDLSYDSESNIDKLENPFYTLDDDSDDSINNDKYVYNYKHLYNHTNVHNELLYSNNEDSKKENLQDYRKENLQDSKKSQKNYIFNLQFISLWLNIYNNNISKYNISNILIYDFNVHFLQNKQIPYPSNKSFNIISDQNINNFLYTLVLYYTNNYKLKSKISYKSNINDVITFIQEIISFFLTKKQIDMCIIGSINLSSIQLINYYQNNVYKKLRIYDLYKDDIFSNDTDFIKNTNIYTILSTTIQLANRFKLNPGIINKPINSKSEMISSSLSLFYHFIAIYTVAQ